MVKLSVGGVGLLLCISIMLGGCSFLGGPPPLPSRSEVVGDWRHRGPSDTAAVLSLHSDGSADATAIPLPVFAIYREQGFGDPVNWHITRDFSGTWELSGRAESYYPTIRVTLKAADNGTTRTLQLSVVKKEGRSVLQIGIDPYNEDALFAFTR